MKIQFDDSALKTHEYPREDVALEEYLKNNPTEKEEAQKEEALRLEDGGGGEDESSDDPETPRGQESQLKTNTPLGAGSGKTGGV